ncbi:MAG: cell division protein ZapA [Silvibacterium sp.]|jgi:cell division protein ZapA
MTEPTRPQPNKASSNGVENISTEYISVDIYDQTYHLRGENPEYIRHLAEIVDAKMRAVASHGKTVDSLRVAVLAALNIADEFATLEQRYNALTGTTNETRNSIRTRAHSLTGLLDSVLGEERKIS